MQLLCQYPGKAFAAPGCAGRGARAEDITLNVPSTSQFFTELPESCHACSLVSDKRSVPCCAEPRKAAADKPRRQRRPSGKRGRDGEGAPAALDALSSGLAAAQAALYGAPGAILVPPVEPIASAACLVRATCPNPFHMG